MFKTRDNNKLIMCTLIIVISIFLFVIGIVSTQQKEENEKSIVSTQKKNENENSTIYRTDIQPLIERFGDSLKIEKCYWKGDIIGKTKIGPSSYWMKGFIILDKITVERLTSEYVFTPTKILFNSEELDPSITGYNNFKWCYSKDMSDDFKGEKFIGDFYLDEVNGIIYFDLECL